MNHKALILIDIQNDYFPDGKFTLENSTQAGANAGKILAHFRDSGQPIIHIQHESVREGASFFIPGTPGVQIHECVAPIAGEPVVIKNYPNSFRETGLQERLEDLGITELVITGMMSNMCVDATTRAANDLGYKCTVIHDACCGAALEFEGKAVNPAEVHTAFMASLGMFYAEMKSSADYIEGRK
ncbi:cysteine hydrolase family protein [Maridesulfovibrio sp. FT414]|uniref:cysteine hydrolase family protein n=1 Tax=Maridesulfovibrio sp. FT414 TaxID=2979469 RepID=UPI003D802818